MFVLGRLAVELRILGKICCEHLQSSSEVASGIV